MVTSLFTSYFELLMIVSFVLILHVSTYYLIISFMAGPKFTIIRACGLYMYVINTFTISEQIHDSVFYFLTQLVYFFDPSPTNLSTFFSLPILSCLLFSPPIYASSKLVRTCICSKLVRICIYMYMYVITLFGTQ